MLFLARQPPSCVASGKSFSLSVPGSSCVRRLHHPPRVCQVDNNEQSNEDNHSHGVRGALPCFSDGSSPQVGTMTRPFLGNI